MEFPFGGLMRDKELHIPKVLILVLVEFPFGDSVSEGKVNWIESVLILVLVEFPFGVDKQLLIEQEFIVVLILVLVEFPFGVFAQYTSSETVKSLS